MSTIYKGNSPNNQSPGVDCSHRGGSPHRGSLGSERPDQNVLNHLGPGIGVLLRVVPGLAAQFERVSCIGQAIVVVGAKPIPKGEISLDFGRSPGPDKQIEIDFGPLELPMRFDAVEQRVGSGHRFADPRHVSRRFEIGAVGDDKQDVDDRFGGETRRRVRTDVFGDYGAIAERVENASTIAIAPPTGVGALSG